VICVASALRGDSGTSEGAGGEGLSDAGTVRRERCRAERAALTATLEEQDRQGRRVAAVGVTQYLLHSLHHQSFQHTEVLVMWCTAAWDLNA
jgi:hypothetical protein